MVSNPIKHKEHTMRTCKTHEQCQHTHIIIIIIILPSPRVEWSVLYTGV